MRAVPSCLFLGLRKLSQVSTRVMYLLGTVVLNVRQPFLSGRHNPPGQISGRLQKGKGKSSVPVGRSESTKVRGSSGHKRFVLCHLPLNHDRSLHPFLCISPLSLLLLRALGSAPRCFAVRVTTDSSKCSSPGPSVSSARSKQVITPGPLEGFSVPRMHTCPCVYHPV